MQTNNTFSIIFFTRKSRNAKNQVSIYVRITVNRQRSEISLKRNVLFKEWDNTKNRGRGTSTKIRILNNYLDYVYNKLLDCHKQLLEEDKIISANVIKARYLGKDDTHKTLKELIEYHNTNMITVLKFGTMKNYYTTEKYLNNYLNRKLKVKDIYLKQLNYRFIIDFEQYLRNYRNSRKQFVLANNGVMKHLERFKKMINLAIKLEWIAKNPFSKFQLKFDKYDRQYLSERELELIESTQYNNERLEKVKDCFIFSCYTGLSYIDVKELTLNQITRGIDGNYWIFTKREKTNETVKVPLLPKALDIIDKYRDISKNTNSKTLLPLCSNQKTNSYLKEIAKDCGIYKNITFHVARHTFATTVMLSNGVPIETVSKLLGHTKLSTTQIYARVIESKISEDIQNLLKRFEIKKQKQLLVVK
ncbi:site-specific integrase [Aureibaculum sp. 2210JD6-5]|uniref:site-specific integrase n=1 Tax=Aureibaculum sp. 2210JD6-5 TaxID=3103957 RepID=UPI002AADD6CB|nr:site-specific integrase [Aureibaculum sp. 2210JD6-5]MDY7396999.1 site-specific integrase [Aureibaculum sp. 2210JD6-5]